jgi:hypothetical protein
VLILIKNRFADPAPERHALLNPTEVLFVDYRGMLALGFDNVERMTNLIFIPSSISALSLNVLTVMVPVPDQFSGIEFVLQDVTDQLGIEPDPRP